MTAKTVTNTITLSRDQAKWLAEVGLSASSTDDVTPIICAAHIEVTGDSARVTCTDRYRVHTAPVKLEAKARAHSFLLSRAALLWLSKNAAFHGRTLAEFNRVTIRTRSVDGIPTTVTITVLASEIDGAASVSWTGELVKGNYPPVLRLFEIAREAEQGGPCRLNLGFLAKAEKLGDVGDAPLLKFTRSENPNKPGPAYLAFTRIVEEGVETYAEAVIQPNLMLR